jgi:hypothetical protein
MARQSSVSAQEETTKGGKGPERTQRRRFARIAANQLAVAECGERYYTVKLIDLSSNGARIEVSGNFDLPTMTHLIIPDIGGRLRCERVWQDGNTVGLRFLEKPYEVSQKMAASVRRLMVPLPVE